jgi:hypothetical protein
MMPVNMSEPSLDGGGDAKLDFHETFPAVVSEKRPKAHGGALRKERVTPSSFIRTVTVGSGIGPDLLTSRWTGSARGLVSLRKPTAGGEFRPALKTLWSCKDSMGLSRT